jgi:hypothetical protein
VLHVNGGEKSLRLTTPTATSHLICQDLVLNEGARGELRLVSYLRSGCDSGYLCTHLSRAANGALYLQLGGRARIPGEACSDLYTAPWPTPSVLLIAARSHVVAPTASCGLAGRYSLTPLPHADLRPLAGCRRPDSLILTAGCGSNHLIVESRCSADSPVSTSSSRLELRCHAHWTESGGDHRLVVSAVGSSSNNNNLLCIAHRESVGGLVSSASCSLEGTPPQFMLSQTGPCIQALSSTSGIHLPELFNQNIAFFVAVYEREADHLNERSRIVMQIRFRLRLLRLWPRI